MSEVRRRRFDKEFKLEAVRLLFNSSNCNIYLFTVLHCGSSSVHSLNKLHDLLQIETSISIKGTSIKTPTTVANAAPEESPNSIADVAIATSKWFEAPIKAEGAAS